MKLRVCVIAASLLSTGMALGAVEAFPRAEVLDVSFTLSGEDAVHYPSISACSELSKTEQLALLVLDKTGAEILSESLSVLDESLPKTLQQVYLGTTKTKPALVAVFHNTQTNRYRLTGCYENKTRLIPERMVYQMRLPNGQTMYPSLGFCAGSDKKTGDILNPIRAVAFSDAGVKIFETASRDKINTAKSKQVTNLWQEKQQQSHTRLSTLMMLTAPNGRTVEQFEFEVMCGGADNASHDDKRRFNLRR